MGLASCINLRQFFPVICRRWAVISLGMSGLLPGNEVQARALSQWSFNPDTYQLKFKTESVIKPELFLLENPTRIVIDLPETTLNQKSVHQNYSGLVNAMRIAQFQPNVTRIVLELSPEAKLVSSPPHLKPVEVLQGEHWQLTLDVKKHHFSLSTLLQLPPATPKTGALPVTVEVPSPPAIGNRPSAFLPREMPLSSGTSFSLRYRGRKPLTLKLEQPALEIWFIENDLRNHQKEMISPGQTPVIEFFETTAQATNLITEAVMSAIKLATSNPRFPVVPVQARSNLFSGRTSSPASAPVTIPPNTVFPLNLTEDWYDNNEIGY